MATSTKKSRRSPERLPIQSFVLRTLYEAGALAPEAVAPEALSLFPELRSGAKTPEHRITQALERLAEKALVRRSPSRVELTDEGYKEAETALLDEYQIPQPSRWDGKWRMVLFDVPEARRSSRLQIRKALKDSGFDCLQDSVWVYPHDCGEFINLLRARYGCATGELITVVAESIEDDRRLKSRFDLD